MAEEQKEKAPKSDKAILQAARDGLKECIDAEEIERKKMLDDLKFATLDQWPSDIRKEREEDKENGPRPCLTIDKLNQYIVQVVNDMRQGKPGINVRPQDDDADVETAKVLKGLIRNIEDQSSADIAYSTAGESAAKIGLGYFRITTEYVSDESFDQDIFIRPIPNTFSVYLGRHFVPDGSDADRGYIVETMPLSKFKTLYPKAKFDVADFDSLQETISYWNTGEVITVIEEYRIESEARTLLYLADGTTMEKADYDKWPAEAGDPPAIEATRESVKKQLKWRKMTGIEVLDERDLPGKYVPIVEVVGRESWVDGRRIVWGLVRPAKDSLRMYNYWASTVTEKMGLAPKAPFIGAKGQFEGVEEKWKKANRVNYAYLEYNPVDVNNNALPRPERQAATPMEAAYFHFMQVIEHDVQTSLGMFKAAVGETESQQSGRAILALQKESDTGTYHFGANLGISIRHAGRIIVDMIPHYYDTRRIVRILGEDGEPQTVTIDPDQEMAHRQVPLEQGGIKSIHNPGVGQYDVSITVGPSYNTKRMEAAATFVEMAKGSADPASAAVLRYLVMRNSDSAGSDEAAKLLKTLLPPQALQAIASKQPLPPEAQAMLQQMQAKMQQMEQAGQELQQENQKLQSGAMVAHEKVLADHDAKMKALHLDEQVEKEKARIAREKFEFEKWLATEQANLETSLNERKAGAEHALKEKQHDFERTQALAADPTLQDAAVLPNVAETLAQMTQLFTNIDSILQRQVVIQDQTLQAQTGILTELQRPKSVSVGAVRKDANGQIVGATVRTH